MSEWQLLSIKNRINFQFVDKIQFFSQCNAAAATALVWGPKWTNDKYFNGLSVEIVSVKNIKPRWDIWKLASTN